MLFVTVDIVMTNKYDANLQLPIQCSIPTLTGTTCHIMKRACARSPVSKLKVHSVGKDICYSLAIPSIKQRALTKLSQDSLCLGHAVTWHSLQQY